MGALTFSFVGQEVVDLGDGTVEGNDIEAMVGGVENQILAHDGQANKAKVTSSHIVSIWRRIRGTRWSPRGPAKVDSRQAQATR